MVPWYLFPIWAISVIAVVLLGIDLFCFLPLVLPGAQTATTAPTGASRRNSMQMLKWSSLRRKAGGWELPKICHRKPLLFEWRPCAILLPREGKISCLHFLSFTDISRFAEVFPALYTVLVLCQVSLLVIGTYISANCMLGLPLWFWSLLIRVSDSCAMASSCVQSVFPSFSVPTTWCQRSTRFGCVSSSSLPTSVGPFSSHILLESSPSSPLDYMKIPWRSFLPR